MNVPTIARELGAMRGLRRVFLGNHQELSNAVSIIDDPGEWLPLWSDHLALQLYQDNLDRIFFNYLAAGYSISASAWKIRKRLGGDRVFPDYHANNPYSKGGLPSFVFELRHVVQHDRVAVSAATLSFSREDLDAPFAGGATFVFTLEQRSFRYSSPAGIAFVQTLSDDLSVSDLVNEFTPALMTFVDWFIGALSGMAP